MRYKNLAQTCAQTSVGPIHSNADSSAKSGAQLYCISAKWHIANVAFH